MKKVVCVCVVVILLALSLSSCRETPPPVETSISDNCSAEEVSEIVTALNDAAQRFEEFAREAEETSVENLEPVIKEMQTVMLEVGDMESPPCALETKAALDSYMSSKIQCTFQTYAAEVGGETGLPTRRVDFCELAPDQLEYYTVKMDKLVEGD